MNDIITRAQLEDAVTILYQRFKDQPEDFDTYSEPRADALALVANIFEIVNNQ